MVKAILVGIMVTFTLVSSFFIFVFFRSGEMLEERDYKIKPGIVGITSDLSKGDCNCDAYYEIHKLDSSQCVNNGKELEDIYE